jgi:DNA helicase IV
LVPPESTKGLEFDSVIVVEPAAIAALGDHGLRLLYIALTRAVRTLTLVHHAPLPEPLR